MFSQVSRGDTLTKTITAINTPQRASDVSIKVKWFVATPNGGGEIKMSYGGTPNQPSLSLSGGWFDLNEVWVQSDTLNDKAEINYGKSFP
jgi:hypothetical protein